jgi:hypothetical protein
MVGAMNKGEQSLERLLEKLLKETEGKDLSLQRIADLLGDTGQAILLVLFSFPFCQPLQIPGFSTPFGIIISLIGIRMTFGGKLWMPQFIGKKKISYHNLEKIVHLTIKAVKKLHFLLAARLDYLVQNPCFHCLNGALIALFGLLLALPLPIPLTNLLSAYPLLAFGLGILWKDGLFILIAYFLCIAFVGGLTALVLLGRASLAAFIS